MFTQEEIDRWRRLKQEKFEHDQNAMMSYALKKSYREGQMLERLSNIKSVMNNLHFSAEKAMEALGIPAVDFPKYRGQL